MAGKYVKTSSGIGKTKNADKLVNGKVMVYLHSGKNILCDPKKIELIGFYE